MWQLSPNFPSVDSIPGKVFADVLSFLPVFNHHGHVELSVSRGWHAGIDRVSMRSDATARAGYALTTTTRERVWCASVCAISHIWRIMCVSLENSACS